MLSDQEQKQAQFKSLFEALNERYKAALDLADEESISEVAGNALFLPVVTAVAEVNIDEGIDLAKRLISENEEGAALTVALAEKLKLEMKRDKAAEGSIEKLYLAAIVELFESYPDSVGEVFRQCEARVVAGAVKSPALVAEVMKDVIQDKLIKPNHLVSKRSPAQAFGTSPETIAAVYARADNTERLIELDEKMEKALAFAAEEIERTDDQELISYLGRINQIDKDLADEIMIRIAAGLDNCTILTTDLSVGLVDGLINSILDELSAEDISMTGADGRKELLFALVSAPLSRNATAAQPSGFSLAPELRGKFLEIKVEAEWNEWMDELFLGKGDITRYFHELRKDTPLLAFNLVNRCRGAITSGKFTRADITLSDVEGLRNELTEANVTVEGGVDHVGEVSITAFLAKHGVLTKPNTYIVGAGR